MNGMHTHTRKHTQARYGEGARTRRRKRNEEGRTKGGQQVRGTQRSTRRPRRRQESHPPPSLYGPSTRGKSMGTQQTDLSTQAQHNRHRHGQAHHGMARRVRSVRTHVDTSADTGMLHAAQRRTPPQQSWCQCGYSMLHADGTELPKGPHTPILPLSHRAQQERKKRTPGLGPRKQAKDRDTHQGAGSEEVHAREEGEPTKSRGKGNERRDHERNRR